MYKLGFIGCGNMATAILNGVVNSQYVNGAEICVFDTCTEKANALKNSLGVEALASAEEVAEKAQVVVLAVKPQVFPEVLP